MSNIKKLQLWFEHDFWEYLSYLTVIGFAVCFITLAFPNFHFLRIWPVKGLPLAFLIDSLVGIIASTLAGHRYTQLWMIVTFLLALGKIILP